MRTVFPFSPQESKKKTYFRKNLPIFMRPPCAHLGTIFAQRKLQITSVLGVKKNGRRYARDMQGVCKAVSLLYSEFREFVTFLKLND